MRRDRSSQRAPRTDVGTRTRRTTLYARFSAAAVARSAREVECITSPTNQNSIAFHTRLGFRIDPGDRTVDGIPVHSDHDGPGLHRVVFTRRLDARGPTRPRDPEELPCPTASP